MKQCVFLFFLIQFSYSQTDSLTYYYNKGELDKAFKYGEKAVTYFEENGLINSDSYTVGLQWLLTLSLQKKDLTQSALYCDKLKNNIDKLKNSGVSLVQSYYLIATFYYDKKNYPFSKEYLQKGIQLSEEKNIENDYYFYLLNLLNTINVDFEYKMSDETKKTLEKQSILTEKLFTKNSFEYLTIINRIAFYYIKKDEFENAEIYYLKVLKISETLFGINHDDYIISLNNISRFYLKKNDFSKADYYNQIGLDIVIKKYGKNHKEYLNFILDKASIKSELGDYDTAFSLYDECFQLSKKIDGGNSSNFGIIVSNIANILYEKKEFKLAETYYLKDYEITKNRFGENHVETAMCLNRLSNIYSSLMADQKAIEYNLKALKIIENTIGKENTNYAIVCSVLGTQYALVNDFKNAEIYYLNSYDIKQKINGKNNISRLTNLKNLIDLYNKYSKIEAQKKYLLEYLELLQYNLIDLNSNFSQSDLLSYYKKIFPNNSYLSLFNQKSNKYTDVNVASYENELLLKNLSLRNQQRIKNSIEKSNDAVLKEKYQQFVSNKRYLTKQEQLSLAERSTDYESLKTETENLEKDITRQSTTFAEAKKTLSIIWKQIQEKLQPNEVVLDLVSYNYYNKKWTDSIMYGAFVIKKDSKFPKYITLFEEKQLKQLLKKENNSIVKTRINQQYQSKAISDLFLKPLEQELNGCKTIYLSPSGLAHQINFKALPINENKTLGEQFSIKLLGSSASIVTYTSNAFQENKNLQFILYGGIDYAKNSTVTTTNESDKVAVRSNFEGGFGYLKGTLPEINDIADQVKANKYEAILKTERYATEESIKQLDGKTEPFVLHLATHGFFYENAKTEIKENNLISENQEKAFFYKASEDPMLRSGLAFAGANKTWGKIKEETSMDDSILTAKEISNLDLSNCQLVVLSACETGLGDINGSEGVFGLQRAFKMAGVKNIIMSLWKVPDAQTAELFTIFYAECFSGKTIHEAFQRAQAKMKVRYSPYYWAGFVLLE